MDATRLTELACRRDEIRRQADLREARRFARSQRDSATRAMLERV